MKSGFNRRCPSGTLGIQVVYAALKRWANQRCASGALCLREGRAVAAVC